MERVVRKDIFKRNGGFRLSRYGQKRQIERHRDTIAKKGGHRKIAKYLKNLMKK